MMKIYNTSGLYKLLRSARSISKPAGIGYHLFSAQNRKISSIPPSSSSLRSVHFPSASYSSIVHKAWRGHRGILSQIRHNSMSSKSAERNEKIDTKRPDSQPTLSENTSSTVIKLSPTDSKSQSGFTDIVKLFKLAKPEVKAMIAAFFCLCISSAVSMLLPMVIGKIMDTSKVANTEEVEIYGMTLTHFYYGLGAVFVTGAIANCCRVILLRTIGERVVARLRTRILKNSLYQDSFFLDSNKVGDLISRISSDANIVSRSITQNISDGLRAILSGTVGLSMMIYVSAKLTGYMMLLFPPIGFVAFIYGRKVRTISKDLQKQIGELTKVSEELLSATKTIQSFSNEKLAVGSFATEVKKVFQIGVREAKLSGLFFGSTGFLGNTTLLFLLFLGTNMVRTGELSVGDLTSFMMYAIYTGSSMFGLSSFYSELMKGAGAASRVFELNERKPTISPTKGYKVSSQDLNGDIVFQNIKFSYPTRPKHQIFDNLNLTIHKGDHVCFVGPSGSGKSTISQLLLRFYDPTSGSIFINGHNLRLLNLLNYRRSIGIVQQEPLLFSGSILENIRYGKPSASDEDIIRAAELANCVPFINSFPDKFDTIIGARGAQLSGGQKQRIALARVLLSDPTLLILDEATSALDSLSEKAINKTLESRIINKKTTISIAHRLSTIKNSSRIIVLNKNGVIVESGEFNTLISNPLSELNKLLRSHQGQEIDPDHPSDPKDGST